jgi:hypothetical protein
VKQAAVTIPKADKASAGGVLKVEAEGRNVLKATAGSVLTSISLKASLPRSAV